MLQHLVYAHLLALNGSDILYVVTSRFYHNYVLTTKAVPLTMRTVVLTMMVVILLRAMAIPLRSLERKAMSMEMMVMMSMTRKAPL